MALLYSLILGYRKKISQKLREQNHCVAHRSILRQRYWKVIETMENNVIGGRLVV